MSKKKEGMYLWMDDVRPMPKGYTHHAHSVNEAKRMIKEAEKKGLPIITLDLDHDMGDYANDGGDGICLLDWLVKRRTFYRIVLHTANPVGKANMNRLIDRWWI